MRVTNNHMYIYVHIYVGICIYMDVKKHTNCTIETSKDR